MKPSLTLSSCLFGICTSLLLTHTAVAAKRNPQAADHPNVILLITDDQGYGDLTAHGNPVLRTPHMDRLHIESARFTDFHVAPMCSPTRGQLMTGIDAMRNGCTAVCQGRSMMRRELPTMADFFAQSGYATGHFGKWHLGDSHPHRPQDRGFHETLHHRAWGITSLADHWGNTYFDPVLDHNGVDKRYEGYCTDIYFNEAMDWIGRQRAAGKPFFCFLPTNTPHAPDMVVESDAAPYTNIDKYDGKQVHAAFYGQIANIDDNLGRLEQFLKKNNLRDDTILIFMTDNGTRSTQAMKLYNAGMRGKKTQVYEGGHRVPCFVRWPGGDLQHGADIGELTQVQDLLPTLIELCGLDAPHARFDGVSLAGLLLGTQQELADRKLVVQYRISGAKWDPAAVMWGTWRLVGPNELYDLKTDPAQTTNIAATRPKIAKAMAEHYEQWHAEARPLFDKPRYIILGAEKANPMMLYAQDWIGGYCDNGGNLFAANTVGYWDVIVERDGEYGFELRRWAPEANLPLIAGASSTNKRFDGRGARPIAKARLKIGGVERSADTAPDDTFVRFIATLKAGTTRLETLFMNKDGRPLCSAIYVKVTRRAD